MLPACLTDDELAAICRPLRQHAAQVRYIRDVLKIRVERRPDGSPLVRRSDWDRAQAQNRATNGPNWSRFA